MVLNNFSTAYKHTLLILTDGTGTVATTSSIGHIAVWSLDEHRLVTTVKDAHDGSVGGMEFIQSQPLMVTSSVDNSIKVMAFNTNTTTSDLPVVNPSPEPICAHVYVY